MDDVAKLQEKIEAEWRRKYKTMFSDVDATQLVSQKKWIDDVIHRMRVCKREKNVNGMTAVLLASQSIFGHLPKEVQKTVFVYLLGKATNPNQRRSPGWGRK